jgi:hypothetical protein
VSGAFWPVAGLGLAPPGSGPLIHVYIQWAFR